MFEGVLELKSVQQGQTVIRGQSSSLFLCLDSRGHLRGQVSEDRSNIPKIPMIPLFFIRWQFGIFFSECLCRGGLHLHRAAAGRWIHPFPVLAPQTSCFPRVKTSDRPPLSPLHSVLAAEEYSDSGNCVWATIKQSPKFKYGLRGSSWDGTGFYCEPSLLNWKVEK